MTSQLCFARTPYGKHFVYLFVVSLLLFMVWLLEAKANQPGERWVNRPVQITSRVDDVLDMAVSTDGETIVYVSGEERPTTLWLASANPERITYPEKRVGGPSVKSSPAVSTHGRFIAYVDTDNDVKGDIYLIDRKLSDSNPVRLTGRETEDGGPCFSANARFLYFHQSIGYGPRSLVYLDLKNPAKKPVTVDTGGDASYCNLSPDLKRIAFVSNRKNSSGDLFVLDRKDGTVRQVTDGPAIDMFPVWHKDSRTLYFSRIGIDINQDNRIDSDDPSSIYRIRVDGNAPAVYPAYPVTPLNQIAYKPYTSADHLYFLSNRGGISNCWMLPESGWIRNVETPERQLAVANTISDRIPYDPYLSLLAFGRVIESYPEDAATSAIAGYRAALILQSLDLPTPAFKAFDQIRTAYPGVVPESIFAEIRKTGLDIEIAMATASETELNLRFAQNLERLQKIIRDNDGVVSAEARIEAATLLLKRVSGAESTANAVSLLDEVLSDSLSDNERKAHALFLQAEIYKNANIDNQTIERLRRIIVDYPEERIWVDRAVEEIIDHTLTRLSNTDRDEKIRRLNQLAANNRETAPLLSMGALNRIGDLYYREREWDQAKAVFENVLETYPVLTTQTAAARLSLAEIFYRQEAFRKAVNLYEQEITLRDSADRIYQLAREGYIRKKVSAGEFHYRLGEVSTARGLFNELLDYDDSIVEAHRGIIKCAVASGELETVLARYKNKRDAEPLNPVWLYCTGLCLTYRPTGKAIEAAKENMEKAILLNGTIEYFHQTLGYAYEVSETVYEKKNQLELALISYQKAYFLNDPDTNPENAANLELNLGNLYYLMGQYGKAFDFYSDRHQRQLLFQDPNTEIVFYKRWGESAFQNDDNQSAAAAFRSAIEQIDALMDPLAASKNYDRLNRYLKDRILDPSLQFKTVREKAEALSEKQSAQNLKAASLTADVMAPPSMQWQRYKTDMTRFMQHQEAINKAAVKLAGSYNSDIERIPGGQPIADARQKLSDLSRKIQGAIDLPERLIDLKAEMLDRLALVYQLDQEWEKASATFERAFSINQRKGNVENLPRNRRSVAYATYRLAENRTGEQRKRLLKISSDDFEHVLLLLEQYGVPEQTEEEKNGLLDISISTSFNAATATQAAWGFTKDQEKRLAETFISRIALELGYLSLSKKELEKQIAAYSSPDGVNEEDLYGVSLLFHRAGLLASGTGDLESAFAYFTFSTRLCLRLENPVSTAANLTNLTSVAQKMLFQTDAPLWSNDRRDILLTIGRQTVSLLADKQSAIGAGLLMRTYNQLGVFYFQCADRVDGFSTSPERTVEKLQFQEKAIAHFSRGVTLYEGIAARKKRTDVETAARLYLNMAQAARRLGDAAVAQNHFHKAIASAEAGVFPDLKWRSLSGLQAYDSALSTLEAVPFYRSGCAPMEILGAFAPLVAEKLTQKQVESALNLTEKLAELERFNRTAAFAQQEDAGEKRFFYGLYARMETIAGLEAEVARADSDRRPFIEKRLADEKELLSRQLGEDDENLPGLYRSIKNPKTRSTAIQLAALSQRIEQTAEELATVRIDLMDSARDSEKKRTLENRLSSTYDKLVKRYQQTSRQAMYEKPVTSPPDFLSLLSPEPFDVMDLSSLLAENEAVARIFRHSQTDAYTAFLLTREEIWAVSAETPTGLKKKIDETIDWTTPTLVFEEPQALGFGPSYPYALSLTHLKQCINNRKPFKGKLGILAETKSFETVPAGYSLLFNGAGKDPNGLPSSLFQVNTLWVANGPSATTTIPTRPENLAVERIGVSLDGGQTVRLETVLANTDNLSLSIVKGCEGDPLYKTGHLFAIFGCPTVIFLDEREHLIPLVSNLLEAYTEVSSIEALLAAEKAYHREKSDEEPCAGTEVCRSKSLLLGYRGMTKRQAANHAKKNFARYVKSGRAAFDRKAYSDALLLFQDAIVVATEVSRYDRYLPDLLNYAGESAYRAGLIDEALTYSTQLSDLLRVKKPGSKKEAMALLRMGLLHSKTENYESAVVSIESAIAIMSEMDPDKDTVQAFMDLGIVLENATRHETSLSRFKSAAKLSRTLNLSELLGEQYLHIGRVYDLRLNQYATALSYYEKAQALFSSLGDAEKIAESKLNKGRCFRLLGDFYEADLLFQQCMDLLDPAVSRHQLLRAKVLIEMANNAWYQGRYEKAFKRQRQCQTLANRFGFFSLQVMALNTEGLIWWTLGDYENASEVLDNALSLAESQTNRPDEIASTMNNIGLVLRDKGAFEDALEAFEKAIEIDSAIDSKWGLAYDFRNKGLTYIKLDRHSEAADLFDQAYGISSGIGNRINAAKSILGKGHALFALNRFKEAETAYAMALELSESMRIKETLWRALFGLARIQLVYHQNPDAAEQYLRSSIEVIEGLRAGIRIKQLKENFIANKLDVYEALVRLLADQEKPVQAFEIAERSRARNFIDLLGGGQIELSGNADQPLYKKLKVLKSEIEILEHQTATADEADRQSHETTLNNLRRELENSVIDLQLQNPQLAAMVAVPPVDTNTLTGLMEPGTALLSYYLLENEIFCWILKGGENADERIRLHRIPVDRPLLEKQVLQYRRIIQNTEPYEKHALALYEKLFRPVEADLDGLRIVGISPHGSLHYLSFATLYDGDAFLVDRYAFFYTPSAAVLEYTLDRRTQRPYRSPRVLAIGNPDLGDPVLDLPFAEEEVGAIKWNFPEITILKGSQATENKVVTDISGFDIIHIASHGEFDPDNPLLSAVKLASPKDQMFTNEKFDGNLEAGEIFGLRMKADMVFLSACQTGLGKITAGDDIVGLNRSFFFAGTHTVISSLWRVSDVSTAVLIKSFYRAYMNQNKADCLKNAAIHVKSRYPHPGYWGAFTLVGDYY